MIAHFGQPLALVLTLPGGSHWLGQDGLLRNLRVALIFMGLTIWIVARGVQAGIEAWSTRLMPLLLAILLGLIIDVLLQPRAIAGLHTYLVPDFAQVTDPALALS